MKVMSLTVGDLTDVWNGRSDMRLKKIYCKKSAEAIVAMVAMTK